MKLFATIVAAILTSAAVIAGVVALLNYDHVKEEAVLRKDITRRAILNNLRAIDEAIEFYRTENAGRLPAKIEDLAVRPVVVAGEDYSKLILAGDGPFTVTTRDGQEVSLPRK